MLHASISFRFLLLGMALFLIPGIAFAAPERYVVTFKQNSVDGTTATQAIEAAGGQVLRGHFEAGLAVVEADDPAFEAAIEGNASIDSCFKDLVRVGSAPAATLASEDIFTQPTMVSARTETSLRTYPLGDAPAKGGLQSMVERDVTDPTQANGFFLQWYLRKISAPEAWAVGALGIPEVEIAVVSTGLDYTHVELQGKVDLSRSISLLPDEDLLLQQLHPGAHPVADLNWIGTFDASLAACNAVNTACVAPNATLIGVKAMNRDFEFQFSDLVSGILYAANLGVDIIHIGAGYALPMSMDNAEDRQTIHAMGRAIDYGFQQGALVVVEAGAETNEGLGIDADHDPPSQVIMPMQASAQALVIGDVGPDCELKLFFSHFGLTLVDVTAPGGRQVLPLPITDFVLAPCSSFSTRIANCTLSKARYLFSSGTHTATGQAAGVAALIDSAAGGELDGNVLRTRMLQATDDIGKPGKDNQFGKGLLNAFTAATQHQ